MPQEMPNDHPLADETERIIGAAIEVHRNLGPGFREDFYENALTHEFRKREIPFTRQSRTKTFYKGEHVGTSQPDFVCFESVVVEIKAVERSPELFKAQVLSYLKATELKVGLLVNFGRERLIDGVERLVL